MKAPRNTADCWLIAFELAEFYQRRLNDAERDGHARKATIMKAKRDTASLLARRFKHGARRLRGKEKG